MSERVVVLDDDDEKSENSKIFLTPDKQLWKVVKRKGNGRKAKSSDICNVHYDGYYIKEDGTRKLFDSSRERGQEFSFTLGAEQTILGLENAVASMEVDEVAMIRMGSKYGYGAAGNPHGFHSMGKAIPANAVLEMEVEFTSCSTKSETDEWDKAMKLPLDQRIVIAKQMKEEGNNLFKAGKFREAATIYKNTIPILKLETPTDEETKKRAEILVPISLNVAQCLIKEHQYKEAETYIDNALFDEPNNVKALYRMAICLQKQKKEDEALEYAKRAQKVKDGKEVRALLAELRESMKQVNKKSSESYKKIFDNKAAPVYSDTHIKKELKEAKEVKEQEKFSNCNICGFRCEKTQMARHIVKAHSKKIDEDMERNPVDMNSFEEVKYWEQDEKK